MRIVGDNGACVCVCLCALQAGVCACVRVGGVVRETAGLMGGGKGLHLPPNTTTTTPINTNI